MLDDSGPVIDDDALAPCLQAALRKDWDVNAALPPGCPCITNSGNLSTGWAWLKQHYPTDSIGLISSINDEVISMFYSFGESVNHCPSAAPRSYNKIHEGLQRLAAQKIPIYMLPGSRHTHTGDKASFFTTSVANVKLYAWVAQLMDGSQPDPPTVQPASVVEDVPSRPTLTWPAYVSAVREGLTPWALP